MNFKEALGNDVNTFFNVNEFAESIEIEGVNVQVVMDSDQLLKQQLKHGGEGLANCEVLFHVKKMDLDFEPFIGQRIRFDGSLRGIEDVKDNLLVYTITLGEVLS